MTERLSAFDGIGRKKAVMAVEILMRHFGVPLAGVECGQVAYDVHVRRVFLRTGLADEDTPEAIDAAAARGVPGRAGHARPARVARRARVVPAARRRVRRVPPRRRRARG